MNIEDIEKIKAELAWRKFLAEENNDYIAPADKKELIELGLYQKFYDNYLKILQLEEILRNYQ